MLQLQASPAGTSIGLTTTMLALSRCRPLPEHRSAGRLLLRRGLVDEHRALGLLALERQVVVSANRSEDDRWHLREAVARPGRPVDRSVGDF
jgi:hypothetical protein